MFHETTSTRGLIRWPWRSLILILSLSVIPALGLLGGCFIGPVVDTAVDQKEYSDNLIDNALLSITPLHPHPKYTLPKDAIRNRLMEKFPPDSSSTALKDYLVSIGSHCRNLDRLGSKYECRYEKHRRVTIYKRTDFFSRGEPKDALFGDRADITVNSDADKLERLTVVFTRLSEKDFSSQFPIDEEKRNH